MDSTTLLNKDESVAPCLLYSFLRHFLVLFYSFIYSFILNLNPLFKQHIHHGTVPDCWLSACASAFLSRCLYMLMLYKSKFVVCHLHPRWPCSKTDPQRLAALHCLLVYMGNDPNLELKVQMKAGKVLEDRNCQFLCQCSMQCYFFPPDEDIACNLGPRNVNF